MKKIFLFTLSSIMILSCATKKQEFKSVNERDVPTRYVDDFKKQRPNVEKRTWNMIDSTSYSANFTDNGNQIRIKYKKTGTETDWIVPTEYTPSLITDYIKNNYPNYKINEVAIVDSKNKKTYQTIISLKKKDIKVLEFDINGVFSSEVLN